MIYSVWNQATRQYDYLEDGRAQATANTPKPTHIPHSSNGDGVPVDLAVWPLSSNNTKIGSGALPKGRIASRLGARNALGAVNMDSSTIGLIGLGLTFYLLWRSDFLKV